jgi:hypothetical protein
MFHIEGIKIKTEDLLDGLDSLSSVPSDTMSPQSDTMSPQSDTMSPQSSECSYDNFSLEDRLSCSWTGDDTIGVCSPLLCFTSTCSPAFKPSLNQSAGGDR